MLPEKWINLKWPLSFYMYSQYIRVLQNMQYTYSCAVWQLHHAHYCTHFFDSGAYIYTDMSDIQSPQETEYCSLSAAVCADNWCSLSLHPSCSTQWPVPSGSYSGKRRDSLDSINQNWPYLVSWHSTIWRPTVVQGGHCSLHPGLSGRQARNGKDVSHWSSQHRQSYCHSWWSTTQEGHCGGATVY